VGHEHRDFIPEASEEPVDVTVDLGDFEVGVTILYENVKNGSGWCSKGCKPRAAPRATFFESIRHAISWQP
jgi:hypothetical protein